MPKSIAILLGALLVFVWGCSPAAESPSVEIELLTWNILHGADAEGRLNLEDKGELISSFGADIVFLQEIDENCERTGGVDQMSVLARMTGMDAAFGSFMPFQGGNYGLGTLSALPARSSRSLRLPEGDEPRVALISEVEVLGLPILAVNVHFNWTEDDTSRFAQAQALLAGLDSLDLPIIVAGDFNDLPESRTLQAFYQAGFEHLEEPGPSWNAREPSVDIDHILVRSGRGLRFESLGGEVVDERELSDHRPVRGRVRVLSTAL